MKSNTEWRYWGESDPLYGVAAWEGREKDGSSPWTDDDFYQLGEKDWADFLEHWQKYGLNPGLCVEIGCGAGRLTMFMAEHFHRLEALDISEAMIRYAQKNIQSPNLVFHLVEGSGIPGSDATVDAVFSTHVFQHFEDRDDAGQYFSEIARVLKPGGSMMIHLPLFSWPAGAGFSVKLLYRVTKLAEKLKAAIKRQAIRRGKAVNLMRMNSYETGWLFKLLPELGFVNIEISVFVTQSNHQPHPFVLAKKAETRL